MVIIDFAKQKYKINYNPVNYNPLTGLYESGSATYIGFKQAKAIKWKCEKCSARFATFKELKNHKVDMHSY